MKYIFKFFIFSLVAGLVITACNKVADLPNYNNGNAVQLTASKSAIVLAMADTSNQVLSFSWSNPNYASDSATYKYVIEIDSAGRNFAKKVTKVISGKREASFTGLELNNIMLNFGFAVGTPGSLDFRVVSSYANNNERYTSNVQTIAITPVTNISVFSSTSTNIQGTVPTSSQTATTFSWSPSFTGYTGNVTYSIQYDSTGKGFASPTEIPLNAADTNKAFTFQEVNGQALGEGIATGTTGKLDYRLKAMTASGVIVYSNVIAVTVKTYDPIAITPPASGRLFIVGNATPSGWANPVDTPAQELTRTGTYTWAAKLKLNGGLSYLFLPVNGSWSVKYGGVGANNTNNPSGDLLKQGGGDLKAPATTGWYSIMVDFKQGTFTVTPATDTMPSALYITGDATPSSWTNSPPASQQLTRTTNGTYQISMSFVPGKYYKFLSVLGQWQPQYGTNTGNASGGTLDANMGGGSDPGSIPTPGTAGNYTITVNLLSNTYTVQ